MSRTQVEFFVQRVAAGDLPQETTEGTSYVGVAERVLRPPIDTSMAGYSRVGKVAKKIHTALTAQAMVLVGTGGRRVAIVFSDLWCPTRYLVERVAAETASRCGIGAEHLVFSGTHTHTAPGHCFGNSLYDVLAQKDSGFREDVTDKLVEDVVRLVEYAARDIRPGKLCVARSTLWGVGRNRSLEAFERNPEHKGWVDNGPWDAPTSALDRFEKAIDPRVTTIIATDESNHLRAAFAILACHATAVGRKLSAYHPDWPGIAAARASSALGDAVVGIGLSAAGDVTPLTSDDLEKGRAKSLGPKRALDLGGVVAAHIQHIVESHEASADRFKVATWWDEWDPARSAGGFPELPRWKYGGPMAGGSEESRTFARTIYPKRCGEPATGGDPGSPHWPKNDMPRTVERCMGADPDALDPAEVHPMMAVQLGEHLLVTVPGEPTGTTGRRIEAAALATLKESESPPHYATVLGYTGDYAGYLTTFEEYSAQHYEGASTIYGPHTARHYRQTLCTMLATPPRSAPITRLRFTTEQRKRDRYD